MSFQTVVPVEQCLHMTRQLKLFQFPDCCRNGKKWIRDITTIISHFKTMANRYPHATHITQDSYQIILQKRKLYGFSKLFKPGKFLKHIFAIGKGLFMLHSTKYTS